LEKRGQAFAQEPKDFVVQLRVAARGENYGGGFRDRNMDRLIADLKIPNLASPGPFHLARKIGKQCIDGKELLVIDWAESDYFG